MKEFFEARRPEQYEGGKRFRSEILDRKTATQPEFGRKRFRFMTEDQLIGVRSIVEADTLDEARQLDEREWQSTLN